MGYELQRLQAKHRFMVDLALSGLDRTAISERMGITKEAVGGIMNSTLFQEELARRAKGREKAVDTAVLNTVSKARELLEEKSYEAVKVLGEIMETGKTDSVRVQASNSILDRVFGKKDNENKAGTIVINTDNLQLLQQVLNEDMDDSEIEQLRALEGTEIKAVSNSEVLPIVVNGQALTTLPL